MSSTGGNGWNRYEERVLAELAALRGDVRKLEETVSHTASREELKVVEQMVNKQAIKLAMVEVKSSLLGAIAGSIPAAIVVLVGLGNG